MSFASFLLRNLRYHWRGNVAVLFGVALGAAVLIGALLVGDSLRGSLRALTLDQLGWVDVALAPGRFFGDSLGAALPAEKTASILMLTGTTSTIGKEAKSAPGTNLLGIDSAFGLDQADVWNTNQAEVALSGNLAKAIGVKVGDRVRFFVHKEEDIPRETLLGRRKSDEIVQSIEATVRAVLGEDGMARFALRPAPEPALNAFFPRRFLQEKLDLVGKANLVLLGKPGDKLDEKLRSSMRLEDWGLSLRGPKERAEAFFKHLDPRGNLDELKKFRWQGRLPDKLRERIGKDNLLHKKDVVEFYKQERSYLSLESQKMFLDPAVVAAAKKTGEAARTFIYLADRIAVNKEEVPYAVVAASDLVGLPATLKENEISLALYDGAPWKDAKAGEKVTIDYYMTDERNHLAKKAAEFVLRETYPLEGLLDDPDWTPEFRGITDKLSMSDWDNPPFPYDAKRVKPADEHFWERYRTTPRAFIALAKAQELWGSRFGKVTAIRMQGDASTIAVGMLAQLDPAAGGFVFQHVKDQGLKAGSGSTDFGVLFLSFSFFLIIASLLLVGLLVRLNLDRRGKEIGLLLATGWTPGQVRRLLLAEGVLLTLIGGLVGLAAARFYASVMLRLLALSWPEGAGLSFLELHATPMSQAVGFGSAVLVGIGTMWWANRVLSKLSPRALLMGESTGAAETGSAALGAKSWWTMVISTVGAVACLVAGMFVQGHEAQAGSFFGSGFLLLAAFLAFAWRRLRASGRHSDPQPTLTRLGIRNAARYPVRSILTAGLLASAAFLVVAVQAFHREAGTAFLAKEGGSGGFPLFAESNVPLFQDLNQKSTWNDLDLSDADQKLWSRASFWPLRVQPGDDASCLNLYQPLKPRVVGVPQSLVRRGGFGPDPSPLHLLDADDAAGIPCLVDANTAQWILKVGIGDFIEVPDEQGQKAKLKVVGLLKESLFQSEVLIAERNFLKLYPRREGFQFLLIEAPPEEVSAVRQSVSKTLAQQGWIVRPTIDRLQLYLAVENTYLGTFQILGALGLLLGAVGLAIVLVRGVWERRAELALLRALGFSGRRLGWLVLSENIFLLALGLGAGCLAAILAVAPHLLGSGAEVLWFRLAMLLGGVLLVGLTAATLAVLASLRTPVLTALRRE